MAPPRSTQLFFSIRKVIDKLLCYESPLSCLSHYSIEATFPKGLALSVTPCIPLDASGRAQWNSTLSHASRSLVDILMNQCRAHISDSIKSELQLCEIEGLSQKHEEEIAAFIAIKSKFLERTKQRKIARDNVDNSSLATRIQYSSDSIVREVHERSAVVPPQETKVTACSPPPSEKTVVNLSSSVNRL